MKFERSNALVISACSLILCLISVSCSQGPQAAPDPNPAGEKPGLFSRLFNSTTSVTIQQGTDLTVTLDQAISTAESRSGDTFRATVAAPVVIEGKTAIPKDAAVMGHVVESVPSGRLRGVAKLDLTLDSVEINGKSYDIATADEGRMGRNHNKRNGILIGGGAGLGALIGAIASGGVGAAIGAAAGAGAGTAGAAYTGKKDIRVPAETTLTFQLTRPVTIPVKS
jgi:hypothetical protein